MNLRCLPSLELVDTYLLDHRESSMFCDPGTANDPRSEAEGNIAGRGIKKLTAFSRFQ